MAGLDHVVHCTSNFDGLRTTMTQVGFTLTPLRVDRLSLLFGISRGSQSYVAVMWRILNHQIDSKIAHKFNR